MATKRKLILITPGDPAGIGPEITWKLLKKNPFKNYVTLLCIGAIESFQQLRAPLVEIDPESLKKGIHPPKSKLPFIWLLRAPSNQLPGFQAGWSIQKAVELIQNKTASALVTGPIHKKRFQEGGFHYPGHTEFLAHLCQTKNITPKVTMMLANRHLRVSLVTTHIPLNAVSSAINVDKICQTIDHTVEHLRRWWKIQTPKIAVAALNPHAGESGILGNEEIQIIAPAILEAQKKHKKTSLISGPHPADTIFVKSGYDAVVCMYHDQALIPVKLLDFPNTVNVSLGLPIVRTSVDHGVGFDIVGKGIAGFPVKNMRPH